MNSKYQKITRLPSLPWLVLLFGLLLTFMNSAQAEGGCPPGLIPASGTDINSCVPIPTGYYNNQQQAQPQPHPPTPPPQWTDKWGAIATDGPGGHLGTASNVSSREIAEQAALADCQTKGGSNCKLENTYGNACAAMVVGDKGHNSNSAKNLNRAVQTGMEICSASDTNCHVYHSDCSLPVQIQ